MKNIAIHPPHFLSILRWEMMKGVGENWNFGIDLRADIADQLNHSLLHTPE